MRTTSDVGSLLFGRARRLILAWLLGHPDEAFFLRQLVRQTGLSTGSVQRELDALVAAGLVIRREEGRQVYFQADRTSPVFPELQSLFVKTAGLADVLRRALAPLSERIAVALVYGSAARGELRNESDIDLLVIGEVTFGEVVDVLGEPQRILGREINPVVYTPADFRARAAAGQHFVSSVLKTDLIFIIGGRDDLEAMGADQQMADRVRHVEGGDHESAQRRRPKSPRQRRRRTQS